MDPTPVPDDVPGASPDLLDGLNDAQRLAVLATEGPTLIVAGAGSGKTRVLTHRIAHLIKDKRVPPTAVLAITFTNKAAREMQERLRHLVGPVVKAMWVSTFHSACVRMLRRSGSHLGYTSTFSIYDEGDAERLMTQVCRQLDYDPKRLSARSMRNAVSAWKDQLIDPETAADRALGWFEKKAAEAYGLYQRRLAESNAMDFDDLILQTVRLFQEHPDVLASYQQRFRYVLVDEFQDTNVAQYELLKLLAAEHRNLSVVGDGDQSIYAFRGATVRNILDFEADYPEANVILLEQNYRSTQTILSAANAVIANNLERKPKNLWTAIGSGNPIVRYQAENEHDEAAYVVEEVERLHDQGLPYGKVVVFYRTNAQSRALEEVFIRTGQPYKVVGGVRFYERREVRDALAYLRMLVNPADQVSLRRILNTPKRGIGDRAVACVQALAEREQTTFWEALRRAEDAPGLATRSLTNIRGFVAMVEELQSMVEAGERADVILETVLARSGYLAELEASDDPQDDTRVENLAELVAVAREFSDDPVAGPSADPADVDAGIVAPGLGDFLERVALVADTDQIPDDDDGVVTLMTLHTAKGLEFPVVFLTGLEDGVFPHARSLGDQPELEEERRLAYVGVTRAQQRLYISRAVVRSAWGAPSHNPGSRFLDELPVDLVDWRRTEAAQTRWGRPDLASGSAARMGQPTQAGRRNFSSAALRADAAAKAKPAREIPSLEPGDRVLHDSFGMGTVVSVEGAADKAVASIDFGSEGVKRLLLRYAPVEKL